MTSKTDGTDTYTYVWNEDNHLESVELNSSPVVDYLYDSGSRMLQRTQGSTTTNFHWDGWDLVREEKDDGVDVEVTNYLVPHGEILAFERDDEWFYLHGDRLSSTQLVTDDTGAQAARIVYGAWGEQLSVNDSVPGGLDVRFVGGLGVRNDSASGLIYMRHRWYDAQLGRFLSRDPIGFEDDFLWRSFPQKMPAVDVGRLEGESNLYQYATNLPADFIDPDGLRCFEVPSDKYRKLAKLRSAVQRLGTYNQAARVSAVMICQGIRAACWGWCATECPSGNCQQGCDVLAGACAANIKWPRCVDPRDYVPANGAPVPRPGLFSPRQ